MNLEAAENILYLGLSTWISLGPVHTGSERRQYIYMFFIKLATEHRLLHKEQISILSRVASRVNKL